MLICKLEHVLYLCCFVQWVVDDNPKGEEKRDKQQRKVKCEVKKKQRERERIKLEEKKDERECKEKKNHWERAAYQAKRRYYVTFLKREWGKG